MSVYKRQITLKQWQSVDAEEYIRYTVYRTETKFAVRFLYKHSLECNSKWHVIHSKITYYTTASSAIKRLRSLGFKEIPTEEQIKLLQYRYWESKQPKQLTLDL